MLRVESLNGACVSRLDSSQDYTDSTGIDLHEFLVNTLKGNPRYAPPQGVLVRACWSTLGRVVLCSALHRLAIT